jgi:hypothetical protein
VNSIRFLDSYENGEREGVREIGESELEREGEREREREQTEQSGEIE